MNFKSILVLGLSVATLGLTLPAHADTASVNGNRQSVILTGNDNDISQKNSTSIRNTQTGRSVRENTGTSNENSQAVDAVGNRNYVDQKNSTDVNNVRRTPRY
jgi:hypothetical protein